MELIISGLALVISVISIIIAIIQIKNDSRCSVMERRINIYLQFMKLYSTIEKHEKNIKEYGFDSITNVDCLFSILTDEITLDKLSIIMEEPRNEQIRKKFFEFRNTLSNLKFEMNLVFSGKEAKETEEFIDSYIDLLNALFRYKIILKKLEKQTAERKPLALLKRTESNFRKDTKNCFDSFVRNYDIIRSHENIKKLEKQII